MKKFNQSSNSKKGIVFALIAALCWGFLAIVLKITVVKIPPETIVWARFLTAFLIVFFVQLFSKGEQFLILKKFPLLAILPGLFLGMNYFGFMNGIKYTTPNNSQVFIQLGPILLAISGFVFYKEKINYKQLIGFLLAITGLALFYSQQLLAFSENEKIYNKGVAWVIFGAVSWAAYAFTQKKLVIKHPVNQLNLIIFGFPALVFTPFIDFSVFYHLNLKWWLLLFLLGLNTYIAYTSISLALKYLEANKVSIIITNNPVITFITMAILAYFNVSWIQHERMNFLSFAGAVFVISGSIIVVKFRIKNNKKI